MRVVLSGAVASSASMRRLEARFATAATLPVSTVSPSPSVTTTAAPGAALANFERGQSLSAAKPCAPTASTTSRRLRPASAAVEALAVDLDLCGGAEHEAHGSTPDVSTP